jgi:uncharacterized protein (TIGR03086 family)
VSLGGHVLELHRAAMRLSVEAVARIRDDQWSRATPCAGWDVRALVAHMTSENIGFAAAARGERADRSVWQAVPSDDPRAAYAASADDVVSAFASAVDEFWLPRIDESRLFPARRAISFHLLDYAVHAWDVAVSIGAPFAMGSALAAEVLDIAYREVPNGPRRLRPTAGFRPARPEPESADPQDRLLAFLGRDAAVREPAAG